MTGEAEEARQHLRVAGARSWLYVPGDRPERFAKAATSGADGIILDLEDAVAPERKDEARRHVMDYLASPPACVVAVRINPLNRLAGLQDMLVLAGANASAILVPKAEEPDLVRLAEQLLREGGSAAALFLLIESARGVANAALIADSSPRAAALMFGAADYAADLGQPVGRLRPDYARGAIVNAAALQGLAAINSPCFVLDDPEMLRQECDAARALGFFGKAAIHPGQISAINAAFRPSEEELALAVRILDLNGGVTTIDGKMVDVAMLRWAKRVAAAR